MADDPDREYNCDVRETPAFTEWVRKWYRPGWAGSDEDDCRLCSILGLAWEGPPDIPLVADTPLPCTVQCSSTVF
jgi:hypothetical protein